nr:RDD family protein [Kribbella shirazensis]
MASWPQRVGGYLVDGVIYGIPGGIGNALTQNDENTGLLIVGLVFSLIGVGLFVYNRWIQQAKTGQTWGKKVLNIKLVGADTGQPIGVGKTILRDITHILDSLACYVGWLWPLWDQKKQTFADKINNTYVVKV